MPNKSRLPRTLIVSDGVPPFVGGSPTIMYTLLKGVHTENSALITQSPEGFSMAKGTGIDRSCELDINRVECKGLSHHFQRGSRIGLPSLMVLLQVPRIINATKSKAASFKPEVLLVSWPSNAYAIAGWIAARRLKLPMVFYLHDLWYETQRTSLQRLIARTFEKRIFKSAARVMTITKSAGEYLHQKYGLDYTVLEHTVDSDIWPLDQVRKKNPAATGTILMLGAVNKYNTDSVVAFSKAVAKQGHYKLRILSRQSLSDLERMGLDTSCLESGFVPKHQLKETILAADFLYLALGFQTDVQKEVEVVLPTRLMDYLPSGIPIIAHGPANTYTLSEAKSRGWAKVINTKDPEALSEELNDFLAQENFDDILNNALAESHRREYFNMSKILADTLEKAIHNQ